MIKLSKAERKRLKRLRQKEKRAPEEESARKEKNKRRKKLKNLKDGSDIQWKRVDYRHNIRLYFNGELSDWINTKFQVMLSTILLRISCCITKCWGPMHTLYLILIPHNLNNKTRNILNGLLHIASTRSRVRVQNWRPLDLCLPRVL